MDCLIFEFQISTSIHMVPVAGLEPARCRQRWILSPLRLPIPSHRQVLMYYTPAFGKNQPPNIFQNFAYVFVVITRKFCGLGGRAFGQGTAFLFILTVL